VGSTPSLDTNLKQNNMNGIHIALIILATLLVASDTIDYLSVNGSNILISTTLLTLLMYEGNAYAGAATAICSAVFIICLIFKKR